MAYMPLTLSRRHVLGSLHSRCERLTQVPVFWNDVMGPPLGFVDESAGHYADAFTFHIEEQFCRKLAAGQILCLFNFESAANIETTKTKKRLRLTSFVLSNREDGESPKVIV
ncbi:MAG TPA: hypothetical protein VNA22_09830 [Pyrinomonadaceae bacterium]|nr:hypothetical protein [Pyrinomonadaceae bacterium]